jgi:hypothetical protein
MVARSAATAPVSDRLAGRLHRSSTAAGTGAAIQGARRFGARRAPLPRGTMTRDRAAPLGPRDARELRQLAAAAANAADAGPAARRRVRGAGVPERPAAVDRLHADRAGRLGADLRPRVSQLPRAVLQDLVLRLTVAARRRSVGSPIVTSHTYASSARSRRRCGCDRPRAGGWRVGVDRGVRPRAHRNTARSITTRFVTISASAVGHWARITLYWSRSSSRMVGTMLKLAAIGVSRVPQ